MMDVWSWVAMAVLLIWAFCGWCMWYVFHVEERQVEERQEQKEIEQRVEEQVQRSWACMACGASCGPERPYGGMCMYCQWDFQAYLQEVA